MRKVLAISTSTPRAEIALSHLNLLSSTWDDQTKHSELVVYKISSLLKKAKLQPKDLDLIAADQGPGSFTGARLAISVAKSFAYALKRPIFCATSLELLAQGTRGFHQGPVVTVINAHKSLLYAQKFLVEGGNVIPKTDGSKALSPEEVLTWVNSETLLVGQLTPSFKDDARLRKASLNDSLNFPSARTLIELAQTSLEKDWRSWPEIDAKYIRNPVL